MSEVFDDIIDRETDVARIAAIVASDFRFAIFGTAAFAVRLLRLYQKLMDGIPMNPRRMGRGPGGAFWGSRDAGQYCSLSEILLGVGYP
jgi:hypothetical protein